MRSLAYHGVDLDICKDVDPSVITRFKQQQGLRWQYHNLAS